MNKLIWTLQALLALAFIGSGGMKLATPAATLRENPQMGWANDFSPAAIKAIGSAEVLGGIGLIVPAATGILPILTPVAGTALALLMGGAVSTHLGRGESPLAPLLLGGLGLAVGWLRWRFARKTHE